MQLQGASGVSDYYISAPPSAVSVELFTSPHCQGTASGNRLDISLNDGVDRTIQIAEGGLYVCSYPGPDDYPIYTLSSSEVALANGIIMSALACPASCRGGPLMALSSRLFLT